MRMDRDPLDRMSVMDRAGGIFPVKELAGYADVDLSAYGHVRQGMLLSGNGDTDTDGYGHIKQGMMLSGHGDADTDATGQIRIYHEVTFSFTGTLAAGKTIVINGENYTVLNDGVNALADFTGDFPLIFGGTNLLTYEDDEAGRSVTITVIKKDRSV